MGPATELWGCLRRVRSMHFVAQSETATGWNGAGTGSVVVAGLSEGTLTFTESGSWRSAEGRESRFSNVFRWVLAGPELVRLEHLRFGPEHPVHLFDLAPGRTGASGRQSNRTSAGRTATRPSCCWERRGCGCCGRSAARKKRERIEYWYGW